MGVIYEMKIMVLVTQYSLLVSCGKKSEWKQKTISKERILKKTDKICPFPGKKT